MEIPSVGYDPNKAAASSRHAKGVIKHEGRKLWTPGLQAESCLSLVQALYPIQPQRGVPRLRGVSEVVLPGLNTDAGSAGVVHFLGFGGSRDIVLQNTKINRTKKNKPH